MGFGGDFGGDVVEPSLAGPFTISVLSGAAVAMYCGRLTLHNLILEDLGQKLLLIFVGGWFTDI